MNKIILITKREYLTRVKKKSFIIMTILGPLLLGALMIVPILLALNSGKNDEKIIAIIDKSNSFENVILETPSIKVDFINNKTIEQIKRATQEELYYALLIIPENPEKEIITMFSYKQVSIDVTQYLKNSIQQEVQRQRFIELNINLEDLSKAQQPITLENLQWQIGGEAEKSYTEISMAVGFILAFLIYMFTFMYGVQVMRGVIEEKTSRIVEIIISSVKPFQLMMGKIIGIALVALTQFSVWTIFSAIIMIITNLFVSTKIPALSTTNNNSIDIMSIFSAISNIDWGIILFTFMFFFIGGYLLYSSLFASVGAAVDNETDTQQFMLPITIPLVVAFLMAETIIANPEGAIAFWFSIIPLTSPVIMMVRIAFGVPEAVPYWQLALSMILLVVAFIGSTWMAGKIYRTGILMYGKKVTYKELWKWLKYK